MIFINPRKGDVGVRPARANRQTPSDATRRLRSGVCIRLVRAGAAAVGTWGVMGCASYAVTATDGSVFAESGDAHDQLASALSASGSRDLPCSAALAVQRLDAARQYMVSGCGFRVVYDVDTPTLMTRRVELVSRARVTVAGEEPASNAPAAGAHARVKTGSTPQTLSSPPPA